MSLRTVMNNAIKDASLRLRNAHALILTKGRWKVSRAGAFHHRGNRTRKFKALGIGKANVAERAELGKRQGRMGCSSSLPRNQLAVSLAGNLDEDPVTHKESFLEDRLRWHLIPYMLEQILAHVGNREADHTVCRRLDESRVHKATAACAHGRGVDPHLTRNIAR